ncbi:hypothetical protein Leryth_003728 [Lithospermum erythrorhizon]|nr:hypothetical protein Leryth_003728 [Lithospermum erythrorhizon]
MAILTPFQLLEINVISAQDLEIVSRRKMKTYATARVNPSRKLTSSVDKEGHNNPTWNDKFVFRVDEEFLRRDTSSVMIEIYAVNWFRDKIVGTVRVLVGNLIPPPSRTYNRNNNIGMRFVALQVRRPSGRPQGILNIGVALLDSSMRSMPLYSQMSASAVGYRDLMDDEHLQNHHQNNDDDDDKQKKNGPPIVKPILLRSKSERSERVTFENQSIANSSILAIAHKMPVLTRDSSILSISDVGIPFMKKTTKASSVISGHELRDTTKKNKGKKGKSGSVLSDSVVSKDSMAFIYFKNEKVKPPKPKEKEVIKNMENKEVSVPITIPKPINNEDSTKIIDDKSSIKSPGVVLGPPPPPFKEKARRGTGKPQQKFIPYEYPLPKVNQKYIVGAAMTDSEVGPPPSEVAAAMAEKRYPLEDGESSVLDGWSVDESVEGLRSKMERWRTELPPIYDRGGFSSSYRSSTIAPPRKQPESEMGLFSCFGNFFGYECQCVCGKPPAKKYPSRYRQSPSFGSRSFL